MNTFVLINKSTNDKIDAETRKMPVKTGSNQRDAVALRKIKKLRNFGPTSAWPARALTALNVVSNETYQNLDPLSLLPKEWIERTPQDDDWEYAKNIFSLSRGILPEDKYIIVQANERATDFYNDMRQLLSVKEKDALNWDDMDSQTLQEQELQSPAISDEFSTSIENNVDERKDLTSEEEDEEDVPIDFQILDSDGDEKEKGNEMNVDSDKDGCPSVRFACETVEESIQAGLKPILKNSWDSDDTFENDLWEESTALEIYSVKAVESYLRIILSAVNRGAARDHPNGHLIWSPIFQSMVVINCKAMQSQNDGAIRRSKGQIPLVPIVAKAYYSTKTPQMRQKVHAQEFGECLAIVQARDIQAQYLERILTLQERTVYMVSIHHRRAYLSVVTFDHGYLANIQRAEGGYLSPRRTAVVRISCKFRLDLEDNRLKLGWALYILCKNVDRA